jgi:preprotein translocase SecE subunit
VHRGRTVLAESESAKKKRRLRAPAETVRERAEKAQAEIIEAKPTKKHRAGRIASSPFRGIGWLGHQAPFKQIGHGLRWFFTLAPFRFLAKILGFRYVRDSWRELKLVTWPTRKQSRQLTVAVIIFSVIFGGLIAIVDYGLDKLFKEVILR